jgi:hypothetical protein
MSSIIPQMTDNRRMLIPPMMVLADGPPLKFRHNRWRRQNDNA